LTDREVEEPDFVIIRSDGQPVFHFVNVVDDLEMKITHVIRGEDHLSNTSRHIALFRAFGAPPPQYAHIPLILNLDGTKMSKRDRGASLNTYMEEGDVQEAVVNYLCLLGWSPKDNREKLPLAEIIQRFDLPQIHRHNARFDIDKLHWLSGEYVREMSRDRFQQLGLAALKRAGCNVDQYPPAYVNAALATCEGKIKRFGELADYAGFYFAAEPQIDPALAAKEFTTESKARLKKLRDSFAQSPDFTAAGIEKTLKAVAGELAIKAGPLVHPTRLACTGKASGPSLYHLLEILGKETVLKRIDRALAL
jgi:glutamyl-tRNA synthetase